MVAALEMAARALAAGEAPVGACLVQDGVITVRAHNGVGAGPDPTAHAEIAVIRAACRSHRTARLAGATLVVTVEPCPMCMAACHYAGIGRVVFGADLADLQAITGRELSGPPPPGLRLLGGIEAEACRELLRAWRPRPSVP